MLSHCHACSEEVPRSTLTLKPAQVSVPSDRCYLFRWRQAADERLEVELMNADRYFIRPERLEERACFFIQFTMVVRLSLNQIEVPVSIRLV